MTKTWKITGVTYPHEYLWSASSKSLIVAETNNREQYYFLMQSLLTSYLAFEAYINYLGERLDPEAWSNEKEFFNKPNYYGIEGKIKRIAETLPGYVFDKGKMPYQSIKKIGKFRTLLVHGKPYRYEKEVTDKGSEIDMHEFNWDEYLSLKNVKESRKAVKGFCESLRSEAKKLLEELYPVFEGTLGSAEGVTI